MQTLILHPDCAAGPVTAISAAIEPTDTGCRVSFHLTGEMDKIVIPAQAAPERMDNLWRTTCFEVFWEGEGPDYREFNLSPSSKWACYDFDDFRVNSRDAPAAVTIMFRHDGQAMTLEAEISSTLPLPAKVALNAIIEDADGNIQFWALAFQPGKAEFHSDVCRALHLSENSK